jgi:YfiH family protein
MAHLFLRFMKILESALLKSQPDVRFGFSTKIAEGAVPPYYFNLSLSVDDDPLIVRQNRERFAQALGLDWNNVALQKQTHSDIVKVITAAGFTGEGDAMLTEKPNIGLAVSSGDCCAIFLFDKKNKVIGGVHSGWRGTEKRILAKTLAKCRDAWHTAPEHIIAYLAPSITWKNYEVGAEVAAKFPGRYVKQVDGKLFLDIISVNHDILLDFGVPPEQIEVSPYCSFERKDLLHSYRRDGAKSGRAYGIIYLTDQHA